jgi:predicted dinucleotide-binding enzyme
VSRVLLIGKGDLAEETGEALAAAGADVDHLEEPEEEEVRAALEAVPIDAAA